MSQTEIDARLRVYVDVLNRHELDKFDLYIDPEVRSNGEQIGLRASGNSSTAFIGTPRTSCDAAL